MKIYVTMNKVLLLTALTCFPLLFSAMSGTQDFTIKSGSLPDLLSIDASSTLKDPNNIYRPENLVDRTWASWCEGKSDNGIGEFFILKFSRPMSIDVFYIKNGFGFKRDFAGNNRVKGLRVSADEFSTDVVLKDTSEVQVVKLVKAVKGKNIKFTILSVYWPTRDRDTCISEISFTPIKINDIDLIPRFNSVSFHLGSGVPYFKLFSDGRAEGHPCGATQLPCEMVPGSGTWEKNPGGSVIIHFSIKSCHFKPGAKEPDDVECSISKSFLKLKKFGVDAIVTESNEIGNSLHWE